MKCVCTWEGISQNGFDCSDIIPFSIVLENVFLAENWLLVYFPYLYW